MNTMTVTGKSPRLSDAGDLLPFPLLTIDGIQPRITTRHEWLSDFRELLEKRREVHVKL